MANVKIMEKSVNEEAPAGTGSDYDLGNAFFAAFVMALYLMCFDPKASLVRLMPVALVVGYYMPRTGQSNTIIVRLGAAILTVLSCFFGTMLSEFRVASKNSFAGFFQYFSSDHIAQAFGAAFHDADFRWYFCAAALAFILAARSRSKSKVSPADQIDREKGEKNLI
jgi:hypothetical protein